LSEAANETEDKIKEKKKLASLFDRCREAKTKGLYSPFSFKVGGALIPKPLLSDTKSTLSKFGQTGQKEEPEPKTRKWINHFWSSEMCFYDCKNGPPKGCLMLILWILDSEGI
jgi:hypothetical protein